MAFSEQLVCVSRISNTTLTTADRYKVAFLTTGGYVTVGDPATTGGNRPFGVYQGGGGRSTTTKVEAVTIGISGLSKIRMMESSTCNPPEFIVASSNGVGGASPTTNHFCVGQLVSFSTGTGTARMGVVKLFPVPIKWQAQYGTAT